MRDEPDWTAIEAQLMGLTLAQLKPLRSTVFNGTLGGASSKASVVGEMVSQMQYWWRYAPHLADEALDAIAETLADADTLADHERRIAAMERKLSHKGGAE